MFFKLFSPSKVDAFAQALGNEMVKRYPPAVANGPGRTISQKRRTAILQEIFADAHCFSQQNRLGVFRKAQLSKTFRWTLRGMGYDENLIDTATGLLIASLTLRPDAGLAHAGKSSAIE